MHGAGAEQSDRRQAWRRDSDGPIDRGLRIHSAGGWLRLLDEATPSACATPFAAIVLLADAEDPDLYLVPTTEWLDASAPFTDRDNVGKRSEPEFGISLARSSLPALAQYRWDERSARDYLR